MQETVAKQVDALVRRLAIEHPEAYSPSQRAVVTPLIAYWSGSSRPQLWILLAASVLLLVASVLGAGAGGDRIYGVIAETIAVRKQEIAIRTALGATRIRLVRGIMATTLGFVFVGEIAGVCVVLLILNRLAGLLYNVAPYSTVVPGRIGDFRLRYFVRSWAWAGMIGGGR